MSEYQQKICLLGDFGVGKTSLVRRFVYGLFEEKYLSTVGVNISRKTLAFGADKLNYLLWDLNGGAKFDTMMISYTAGAVGALIVGDLTRLETFDKMTYYAEKFSKLRPKAHLVFVGNKVDVANQHWRINPRQIDELARRFSAAPVFLTSAKDGSQVEEMFTTLGAMTLNK
jgi:small GTP-binding protein